MYVPQTGWKAPRYASFNTVVEALIAHRKGNAFLRKKHGWSTDYAAVANEVDEFNANVCLKHGWNDYVANAAPGGGSSSTPFPRSSLPAAFAKVAAGGRILVEWINSGEEAVPEVQANTRAAVCATCPMNEKGDWTTFFTKPASEAIRKALEKRREWNLSTPYDSELGVCSACSCPLPLKMHVPLARILSKMPKESKDALHKDCWIRSEEAHAG
jgi:hypothetical protein